MKTVVIGTRGSKLALWQARYIQTRLEELGHQARLEIIKTTGDRITDVALAKVGAESGLKGVFTKEIEEALLAGSIDLAVHSLKDLPTELPAGLALGCTPERADPRDALCGKTLAEVQPGDRIGTSSLRRAAQMRALKPGIEILDIRGNVDTRLRKLGEGDYDAILLACAGLRRLDLEQHIREALEPATFAPAVGQGALGIEIRDGDEETREILAPLNDEATRVSVGAERSLLDALGGGCQVPLGAHARLNDANLELSAVVVSPDGKTRIRASLQGSPSAFAAIGEAVAALLQEQGADSIIAEPQE